MTPDPPGPEDVPDRTDGGWRPDDGATSLAGEGVGGTPDDPYAHEPADHGAPEAADPGHGSDHPSDEDDGPDDDPDGDPEDDPDGDEDGDLGSWFAGDWVDPSVLPGGTDTDADDDLPGDPEIAQVAQLLWRRAAPGMPPPADADDTGTLLQAVSDRGRDDLDQQAARILLRMLGGAGS
ncbi:hypothetical protein SAMN06893096_106223 [Geodermatophilus pulveris]|uniref:Uncharacterized protein n=1 Tax=Geodermatophilus pulveris TaxID=1564159 RepID=A0A239GJN5_9ACTN|nr:hypothetical protein [Geodermatophilus pulveris]SNS68988.1 hypothetical protein SAMN06893096_106223 [Geodermatophilus pulveris]